MESYNVIYNYYYGVGTRCTLGGLLFFVVCSIGVALIWSCISSIYQKARYGYSDECRVSIFTKFVIVFLIGYTATFSEDIFSVFLKQDKHYSIENQAGKREIKETRCLTSPDGIHFCEIDGKAHIVKSYKEVEFPEYIPKY